MKDKDRLFLLFNPYIEGISTADVNEFIRKFSENVIDGAFDNSVRTFINPTYDASLPAVQAVTPFPVDGIRLIEDMIEAYESGEEELFEIRKQAVKDYIKASKG